MTERIVDAFESVEIETKDRDLLAGADDPADRLIERLTEEGAVWQVCQ